MVVYGHVLPIVQCVRTYNKHPNKVKSLDTLVLKQCIDGDIMLYVIVCRLWPKRLDSQIATKSTLPCSSGQHMTLVSQQLSPHIVHVLSNVELHIL